MSDWRKEEKRERERETERKREQCMSIFIFFVQSVAHVEAVIDFGEDENIEEGLLPQGESGGESD